MAKKPAGKKNASKGKSTGPKPKVAAGSTGAAEDDDAFLDNLLAEIEKQKLSAPPKESQDNKAETAKAEDPDEDEGRDKSNDPDVASLIPEDGSAVSKQTRPPRIPLNKIYIDGRYPECEIVEYTKGEDNIKRITNEEKRALEKTKENVGKIEALRRGAEIHRQVRGWARENIKPGMKMVQIANLIENTTRALTNGKDLKDAGIGFPTGLSVNDCAAHYTPNKGDTKVLNKGDVLKVDFGVHVDGRIIDSAFTMALDEETPGKYDNLLKAVKAATNTGIREAGIDARLGEIGAAIQETMESYEIELDGKTLPIKCIRNLNGHNIVPYRIHGGKTVPIVKNEDQTKMEEGDVFAIETFGSTGRGYVIEQGECSHYARNPDAGSSSYIKLNSAKSLLNTIDKSFGTLPFCKRYLDRLGEEKYLLALNSLVRSGHVDPYPPLVDSAGSYTAQFEHTLVLRPTCKEVLSRGDDY